MMRTQGCYEGSHFGSEGVEVENGIADTLGSRGRGSGADLFADYGVNACLVWVGAVVHGAVEFCP